MLWPSLHSILAMNPVMFQRMSSLFISFSHDILKLEMCLSDYNFLLFIIIFNCTLGSEVHVQIMQDCCIGTYMARRFAAFISPSPISGISPLVIPLTLTIPYCPSTNPPLNWPQCVMLPSLCPHVLIVQHPPMSDNMWCLVFCSCVSLLRMMVSRFIHVPIKDTNSSFFVTT